MIESTKATYLIVSIVLLLSVYAVMAQDNIILGIYGMEIKYSFQKYIIVIPSVVAGLYFLYMFYITKYIPVVEIFSICPKCKETFDYKDLKDGKCLHCENIDTIDIEKHYKDKKDKINDETKSN